MSSRRALWLSLALFAACDDDVADPPQLDGGSLTFVDASPAMLDAAIEEEDASIAAPLDASAHDATAVDASPAVEDASAEDAGTPDAGPLDCSTLGLTYDNYGAQFVYLWCLSCHAKTEPHLDTPEQIQLWLPAIHSTAVASKRMPPGGNANYLRDHQREEFGRWLDCGAP